MALCHCEFLLRSVAQRILLKSSFNLWPSAINWTLEWYNASLSERTVSFRREAYRFGKTCFSNEKDVDYLIRQYCAHHLLNQLQAF